MQGSQIKIYSKGSHLYQHAHRIIFNISTVKIILVYILKHKSIAGKYAYNCKYVTGSKISKDLLSTASIESFLNMSKFPCSIWHMRSSNCVPSIVEHISNINSGFVTVADIKFVYISPIRYVNILISSSWQSYKENILQVCVLNLLKTALLGKGLSNRQCSYVDKGDWPNHCWLVENIYRKKNLSTLNSQCLVRFCSEITFHIYLNTVVGYQ